MATKIYKGQDVTLSTSEVAYELAGDVEFPITTITLVLVSGTLQYTVAATNADPILDVTYPTNSTAAEKFIVTLEPGHSTLRMKCASAGVVKVSW